MTPGTAAILAAGARGSGRDHPIGGSFRESLNSSRLEADSHGMSEAASKRGRGRPQVFSDAELRREAQFAYARRVRPRGGAQDLVYRKFPLVAIELYRESHPQAAQALDWLLFPTPRHRLLSGTRRGGGTCS